MDTRNPGNDDPPFKDHFSGHAAAYARDRPDYPPALFAFLAAQAPARALALDCATGNGQAAAGLAAHFDRVLALDASRAQLAHTLPHPRIRYLAAAAERLPIASATMDLVAAAQAAHWFDFARFHAECRRVLRPGGVVALWGYANCRVDPAVDAVVGHFYAEDLGAYWPPERHYVEQGYRTLPFPYEELPSPAFELQRCWDRDTLMRYLGTWSAVQRYRAARGTDPLDTLLRPALAIAWPDAEAGVAREVSWPIHLRLGRV